LGLLSSEKNIMGRADRHNTMFVSFYFLYLTAELAMLFKNKKYEQKNKKQFTTGSYP
jgi:hypothetical protein